ncbi:PEPxxWA-CTERM sorting domain-containing protein [Sphingomonas tabacisoli]|uniref:PEPxxWA-CTERM sorting domain-containing protein n=1 Tax=Sphingomonas tabacisoli TaxID=2249466 RepID=A0ABW4I686_9SPHN
MSKMRLLASAAISIFAVSVPATAAWADDDCGSLREEFCEAEHPELVSPADDPFLGAGALAQTYVGSPGSVVQLGFEGVNQYDAASFARNFIPPDTMGAVGTTQYMETSNGAYGIFDKATGNRLSVVSDVAFWASAGQTGANGDSRIMFNKDANRWVVLSFGASVADIQIAVSDTDNALGTWKSTKFTAYTPAAGLFNGVADYPTLAMDKNALYMGTNDYAASTPGGSQTFRGTTLNVIPLSSIFAAGGPTVAGNDQFFSPLGQSNPDRGFAIQGVNSDAAGPNGKAFAVQAYGFGDTTYNINNAAGAATQGNVTLINYAYDSNGAGRQPNAVPDTDVNPADTITSNNRVIDTLDDRIGSSVYEVNGRIYALHTITPTGSDHTAVAIDVVDSATKTLLSQTLISGGGDYDYYEGSLAVNANGDVVVGYNRSGSLATGQSGVISVFARVFRTNADGSLQQGDSYLLKQSLVDDYHNGSLDGQVAAGRQRWGDYSQVSLDPTDPTKFWLIGEYAREYNDAAGGHPGGTGGSRWSTWIAEINFAAVPEPATWAMMLAGFGMVGLAMRRSQKAGVRFA